MKMLLMLVIIAMPFSFMRAQIGINTREPFSSLLFHIDSKGNTSSVLSTQDDDIVVTEDGKVGIGTTTPNSDLTINGSLKIKNGTEGQGKVLAAMSDGTAFWEKDILDSTIKNAVLNISTYCSPYYNVVYKVLPTSSYAFSSTIDGASFDVSKGILHLPPGYYNISMTSTIPTTYDFFTMRTYINNELFLEGSGLATSVGFNTLYESSSQFSLNFEAIWTRPTGSISFQMNPSNYSPPLGVKVCVEKILL